MPITKRDILATLSQPELLDIARRCGLEGMTKTPKADLLDGIAPSAAADLTKILPTLAYESLKSACKDLGLPGDGRDKATFVTRLLAAVTLPGHPVPQAAPRADDDFTLELQVEPRKPRLAWQGMDRKEALVAVPTQVVEIVRPGRARERGDALPLMDAKTQIAGKGSDGAEVSPNRLIWTNDNLVALQTLLEEKDPVTRGYRYRGKVDLVYIDPPFMVNNDFRADNTIEIDIDGEEGVQATKEPSLVELLAYRDTWRQGLDSFLSMLKRRLELLKELLAPTGSIYVHLDWHAVHYVKVMMDELFGYDHFRNEIVWHYKSGGRSKSGYSFKHDSILGYAIADAPFFDYEVVGEERGAQKRNNMKRGQDPDGRMFWSIMSAGKLYKYYDDEKLTPDDVWSDISHLQQKDPERLGYPTQKPRKLVERIIAGSSPPGGLILDCFIGSGTTCEAAERLGRRWIGIDIGKYAVHLARKRLIRLDSQPKPAEKPQYTYEECNICGNVERKEKPVKSRELFSVRPFTIENMGVYQRAELWQDFQSQKSRYRDEMIKVFGGEPGTLGQHLHGRKDGAWIHVGPLDGAISSNQVWAIAREAARTDTKAVTVLAADFNTLSGGDSDEIQRVTGVRVIIRVIPQHAIDEVRRRIEILRHPDGERAIESMAIPAFYAPLSIVLAISTKGRLAQVTLERCEIDIQSFIQSQRPVLKTVTDGMGAAARKKAMAERDKWSLREKELNKWLLKATTWQKFIDFWAIDWDYGHRTGADDKPIFDSPWQSMRLRKSKDEVEGLVFSAEYQYAQPGEYRIAARVTDVFGNDGIATVICKVN